MHSTEALAYQPQSERVRPSGPVFNRVRELFRNAVSPPVVSDQLDSLRRLNSVLEVEEARRQGKIDDGTYKLMHILRTGHANNLGYPMVFIDEVDDESSERIGGISYDKIAQSFQCGEGRPLRGGLNQTDVQAAVDEIEGFQRLASELPEDYLQLTNEEWLGFISVNGNWTESSGTKNKYFNLLNPRSNGSVHIPDEWVTPEADRVDRAVEIFIRGMRARGLYQTIIHQQQLGQSDRHRITLDNKHQQTIGALRDNPLFSNSVYGEFYQRNQGLIDDFERAEFRRSSGNEEAWDENRWREFMIGLEIDIQLRAVALDYPQEPEETQLEFLMAELESPSSLELIESRDEADKLHHARMLAVPNKLGDLEPMTAEERMWLETGEPRKIGADKMVQSRLDGNSLVVSSGETYEANLRDMEIALDKLRDVRPDEFDPERDPLKEALTLLHPGTSPMPDLLQTLIDASYDLKLRIEHDKLLPAEQERIREAQRNLSLVIARSHATRIAEVVHKLVLGGEAYKRTTGHLEHGQQYGRNDEVDQAIARNNKRMRRLLSNPLFSPEAAAALYNDVQNFRDVRILHILHRLKEFNPERDDVFIEESQLLEQKLQMGKELSQDFEKAADLFAERLIGPVAKRGKRYLAVERDMDRIFSDEKSKINRDTRFRVRQNLREFEIFLKTADGRRFLKQLDDEKFLQRMVKLAKKGDRLVRGKIVERGGERIKEYDHPEGQFLAYSGRWLPVILEYRQLRRRLFNMNQAQGISSDNRHLEEFDRIHLKLPMHLDDDLHYIEDMLEAGPRRRIESKAKKIPGKLAEKTENLRTAMGIDDWSVVGAAEDARRMRSETRGRERVESRRLRQGEQTAADGSDLRELNSLVAAPVWDNVASTQGLEIGRVLREKIRSWHNRLRGRVDEEGLRDEAHIPFHEVRSQLPANVSNTREGRLIENLEEVGDIPTCNEDRLDTSWRVLRTTIEDDLIPRLEEERNSDNPNVKSYQSREPRTITFRDPQNHRQINIGYSMEGDRPHLLHAEFRVYPLGDEIGSRVGLPAFNLTIDAANNTYEVVSDYNTDPATDYSRIETRIIQNEGGLQAICMENRGVNERSGEATRHRSAQRRWNYARSDVAVPDAQVTHHTESNFIPPGSGEGAVDLPGIFNLYSDYVSSLIPVRAEVKVRVPERDRGPFSSENWQRAVSLLEQISWRNEDEDHNHTVKKAAFDMFQGSNQGNLPIVQESFRRAEREERPEGNIEEFTRHIENLRNVIDRFEEIVREIDPIRLRQMLESAIETDSLHPPDEAVRVLIDRINGAHLAIDNYGSPLPADFPDMEAAFVDYWLYLTNRFDGINEFLRRRGQDPDMLLYIENQRLTQHPLIGELEQRVFRAGESIRQARELLNSIPLEQRF